MFKVAFLFPSCIIHLAKNSPEFFRYTALISNLLSTKTGANQTDLRFFKEKTGD